MAAPAQSRPTRRQRQHLRHGHRPPSDSTAAVTALDRRRYFDARTMSPEEIAAREGVKLATVAKSLDKMRAHVAQFSAESAELATREVYLQSLPEAAAVLQRALTATKLQPTVEMVRRFDVEAQEFVDEAVAIDKEVPDIAMQLKGQEALRALLASVQPKTPMVTVDARSQTNIAQMPGQPGLAGGGQPLTLSAESIIRQVRADRGLALPAGSDVQAQAALAPPPVERDTELDDEDEVEDDEAVGETAAEYVGEEAASSEEPPNE